MDDAFLLTIEQSTSNKRRFAELGPVEAMQRNLPASPEGTTKLARRDTDAPLTKYASEKTMKLISTPTRDSTRASPTLVTTLLDDEEEEEEEADQSSVAEAYPVDVVRVRTAVERFSEAQADARRCGKDDSLKWKYDENDELTGATCGDATFTRDELVQLSSQLATGS